MKVRVRRLLLEFVAFLIVGVVLLTGVGVWKLSSGPVSLTFLTSTIEDALNPPGADYQVEIGGTEMTWGGWERAVDLVAVDVTLRDARGAEIATLPKLAVGLTLVDIVDGVVRVSSIDLFDADLFLIRREDGSLAFAVNPPGAPDADGGAASAPIPRETVEGAVVPPAVIDELAAPPDPDRPLGALNRIVISGGAVLFDDRARGEVWHADRLNAIMLRDAMGLEATVSGRAVLREGTSDFEMTLSHEFGAERFDLGGKLGDLPLSIGLRWLPGLEPWLPEGQRGTVSFDLSVDRQGRARRAVVRLQTPFAALSVEADAGPDGAISGDITVERLEPARLAELAPKLAPLGRVNVPLAGAGRFALGSDAALRAARLSLGGEEGLLDLPSLFPSPRVFYAIDAGVSLEARPEGGYDAALETFSLDLGGPRLSATATAALSPEDGLSGRFDALLTDLPMEQLGSFWPESLAVDAREWVVPNIPSAEVDQASFGVSFAAPQLSSPDAVIAAAGAEEPPAFALSELGGTIEFRDATTDYLSPLTPAEGVDGRAVYTDERFDITVESGRVDDIVIEAGEIAITGFQLEDQAIDIQLDLDAPLPTALALLDTEPYGFVSRLGLDAERIEGASKTKARFEFPLVSDLTGDQVRFEAAARLSEVRFTEPSLDIAVVAPTLDLWIDNAGLDVAGPVRLDGVAAALTWRENFAARETMARQITLEGTPTAGDLARFGLDLGEIVEGEMGVTLTYGVDRAEIQTVRLAADVAEAKLTLAPLNWAKPRGEAGSLDLDAVITPDGSISVPFMRLVADDAESGFAAELSFDAMPGFKGLEAARLERLSYGRNRISGTLGRAPDGTYEIDVEGPSFDISGLLGSDEEEPGDDGAEETGPAFHLTASLGELRDGQFRMLKDAWIDMRHDGDEIVELRLDSKVSETAELDFDFAPEPGGARRLNVVSGDAGAALASLDWTDRIQGGSLRIDGYRPAEDEPMTGHATIDDFILSDAPALAKLLEFMSLTGMLSALTESGLPFQKFEADYSFQDGVVAFENTRAYGGALGITAAGRLDTEAETTEFEGTIAPMNSINQVLNAIPIIGQILTGGEGVFAATYQVEGPIGDPEVSVNPLSVLAPGFLRNLFGALPEGTAPPADQPSVREEGR